jgi:hypothetical protein
VYEQEIQETTRKLKQARQQLTEVKRFHKMLYETGEDALEPVVREALRQLGAQVTDPPPRSGKEDGRLVSPAGDNGMLEIKGPQGPLKLRDVRQLDQWVRDAIAEEEWESKGLLIVNAYHKTPLADRGNPFPDNCIKAAKRFEICLMTTSQLFRALVVDQRGELDRDQFWATIFDTNGPCSLPDALANGIVAEPKQDQNGEDQDESF